MMQMWANQRSRSRLQMTLFNAHSPVTHLPQVLRKAARARKSTGPCSIPYEPLVSEKTEACQGGSSR
jgi:hypothetical protein